MPEDEALLRMHDVSIGENKTKQILVAFSINRRIGGFNYPIPIETMPLSHGRSVISVSIILIPSKTLPHSQKLIGLII